MATSTTGVRAAAGAPLAGAPEAAGFALAAALAAAGFALAAALAAAGFALAAPAEALAGAAPNDEAGAVAPPQAARPRLAVRMPVSTTEFRVKAVLS